MSKPNSFVWPDYPFTIPLPDEDEEDESESDDEYNEPELKRSGE